jgi:hypothetical protein
MPVPGRRVWKIRILNVCNWFAHGFRHSSDADAIRKLPETESKGALRDQPHAVPI